MQLEGFNGLEAVIAPIFPVKNTRNQVILSTSVTVMSTNDHTMRNLISFLQEKVKLFSLTFHLYLLQRAGGGMHQFLI